MGIDLFNHGYHLKPREAWEPLGMRQRQLTAPHILQGLILLTAAGVKVRKAKPVARSATQGTPPIYSIKYGWGQAPPSQGEATGAVSFESFSRLRQAALRKL